MSSDYTSFITNGPIVAKAREYAGAHPYGGLKLASIPLMALAAGVIIAIAFSVRAVISSTSSSSASTSTSHSSSHSASASTSASGSVAAANLFARPPFEVPVYEPMNRKARRDQVKRATDKPNIPQFEALDTAGGMAEF